MQTLKLVIGSKNSSSWSLRPWLLLRQVGFPFEEIVIPLRRPDTAQRIRALSPSGKVPLLMVGDVKIWDSLAICEFLAEYDPSLWPADSRARAIARSVSAEMHAGFSALRTFLPMDFTARFGPPGRLLTPVQADVDRIASIWTECRRHHGAGGPFLFGPFTIADAMFAPVCSRFTTHAVPLDPVPASYVDTIMGLPAMQEWARAAAAEAAGIPTAPTAPEPRAPRMPVPAGVAAAPFPEPARLPPTFAPEVVLADAESPPVAAPAAATPQPPSPAPFRVEPKPAAPLSPTPRPPSPHDAPEDIRRALRPIPSTVMIKPIGDHPHRGRKPR
jgi:glutathione S-transferase